MKKTAIFFTILITLLVGATSTFGQARKLADTRWKLIEAQGVAVTRSLASIEFDAALRRFTGNTGCNAMSGEVNARANRLELSRIISTKRACKLMEGNVGEGTYISALAETRRFSMSGGTLRMMDRRGRTVLRFTRMFGSEHDRSPGLADQKWVLEQIRGRQTFVALPLAFLNFDERKGSAGGDTSCNVFGGSYKASGNSIAFSNIIGTMRACIEDNKMSVEREFLDGLRNANRYEIRDGRLFLYQGRQLLLSFRGEEK